MKKRLISILTLLALCLTLLPMPVGAAATSGTCGANLTWSMNGTTLTISGTGAMTDFQATSSSVPWTRNITRVVIEDGVTHIGTRAFSGCTYLTSVTIPDSVTTIGAYAFYNCESLESIDLPPALEAIEDHTFYNCSSLTSIVIPESVTAVWSFAFYKCYALSSVTFPSNLKNISMRAFAYCTSLSTVSLPSSALTLGEYTFEDCSGLKRVIIPKTIKKLPKGTFQGASKLETAIFLGENCSIASPDSYGRGPISLKATIHCFGSQASYPGYSSDYYSPYAYAAHYKMPFHSLERIDPVEATCTSTGLTAKYYCAECDEYMAGGEVVPMKAHRSGSVQRENVVEPTCSTPGSRDDVTYCLDCGAQTSRKTVSVDTLPHTPGLPQTENRVEPTCTTPGSYDSTRYCTVCGARTHHSHITLPALGHTPGDPVRENEIAPTFTSEGSYDLAVYCTVCDSLLSRVSHTIPMLQHTPSEPVQENVTPATCFSTGMCDEVVYCAVCGEELSREENKILEKLPHTPGEPVRINVVPPTYDKFGSCDEVVYCTVCDEELSRKEDITLDKLHAAPVENGNLALANVKPIADMEYRGYTLLPPISAEYCGMHLTENVDYTVTYENNTDAGVAYAVLTGIGGCYGTKRVPFRIKPADLCYAEVSGLKNEVSMSKTASQCTQSFTVSRNGSQLVAGQDYEAWFENNTGPGIAILKIVGKGNYCGSKQCSFLIKMSSSSGSSSSIDLTYAKRNSSTSLTAGSRVTFYMNLNDGMVAEYTVKNSSGSTVDSGGISSCPSSSGTKLSLGSYTFNSPGTYTIKYKITGYTAVISGGQYWYRSKGYGTTYSQTVFVSSAPSSGSGSVQALSAGKSVKQGFHDLYLSVNVTATAGADSSLSWRSSNSSVASVTGGYVSIKSPGQVTITASTATKSVDIPLNIQAINLSDAVDAVHLSRTEDGYQVTAISADGTLEKDRDYTVSITENQNAVRVTLRGRGLFTGQAEYFFPPIFLNFISAAPIANGVSCQIQPGLLSGSGLLVATTHNDKGRTIGMDCIPVSNLTDGISKVAYPLPRQGASGLTCKVFLIDSTTFAPLCMPVEFTYP